VNIKIFAAERNGALYIVALCQASDDIYLSSFKKLRLPCVALIHPDPSKNHGCISRIPVIVVADGDAMVMASQDQKVYGDPYGRLCWKISLVKSSN
jgi:hypothetical protein